MVAVLEDTPKGRLVTRMFGEWEWEEGRLSEPNGPTWYPLRPQASHHLQVLHLAVFWAPTLVLKPTICLDLGGYKDFRRVRWAMATRANPTEGSAAS